MSYVSAETKLRTLAAANVTLQGFFGDPTTPTAANKFRWFDTQLPQRQISIGSLVVIKRISTIRYYLQLGINNVSVPRFQFDVYAPNTTNGDANPELGRQAAAAVIDWLGTVDLVQDDYTVPNPPQFPSYLLNQRGNLNYDLEPPVWVQSLDVRIFNLEV